MHDVGWGLLQHALNVNQISQVSKRQASHKASQHITLLYLQSYCHCLIDNVCKKKQPSLQCYLNMYVFYVHLQTGKKNRMALGDLRSRHDSSLVKQMVVIQVSNQAEGFLSVD